MVDMKSNKKFYEVLMAFFMTVALDTAMTFVI